MTGPEKCAPPAVGETGPGGNKATIKANNLGTDNTPLGYDSPRAGDGPPRPFTPEWFDVSDEDRDLYWREQLEAEHDAAHASAEAYVALLEDDGERDEDELRAAYDQHYWSWFDLNPDRPRREPTAEEQRAWADELRAEDEAEDRRRAERDRRNRMEELANARKKAALMAGSGISPSLLTPFERAVADHYAATERRRAEQYLAEAASGRAETPAERRARLDSLVVRASESEYASLAGRSMGRDLWRADQLALAVADPERAAELAMRFAVFDRDAVVDMPAPLEMIVGTLPPQGEIGELSGSRGLGKSLLSLDLAGHVASTFDEWCGRRINVHGPVLYVAREGWQGFGKRVRAWELHHVRHLDGVIFTPSAVDLRNPEEAHALGVFAKARCAVMVVLDSAQGTGIGAEDTSDTADYNMGVRMVRDISGAAVMVLHNSGWDESRGRGSTLLPDIAGTVLHFRGDPKPTGTRVLENQKDRDTDSNGKALPFRFQQYVIGQDSGGVDITSGVLVPTSPDATLQAYAVAEQDALDALVAQLDELKVPLKMGRDKARELLKAAGVSVRNERLSAALRIRRERVQ